MQSSKYIVGIDLGTTHCALAYTPASSSENEDPSVQLFQIPQLIDAGEVAAQRLLPSFLLLPGPQDVAKGGLALPWKVDADYAVGGYARDRGAELPARLVASAKSWLSHPGIDRKAPILPWEAPEDARHISPLDAMTRFLEHMRDAWNHEMAGSNPEDRLEAQEIYLTVPASFDAVARELTAQAAGSAGFRNVTLLEEPQAAFYAWIAAHQREWRDQVEVGESILVCDVGGGTTDFSLIEVMEEEGNLDLRRAAVGDHILLGGDNMDLALAYALRAKLAQSGTQLDTWQFRSLWHRCRAAKERMLNDPKLESEPVVLLGRGSSLIGGTIRTELARTEIESILGQGFFPLVEASEHPEKKPQTGIREMGLPHAADPAVTRHLAAFLHKQVSRDGGTGSVRFPSAVLFNGGVMKAAPLRERILEALTLWSDSEVRELEAIDLDLSVARGAAYYGLARKGHGIRIRAGAARSYYIGIESSMPSVPGVPTPMKALCVVPFGMEEGSRAELKQKSFGLIVGDRAVFHLLASNTRKNDAAGAIIEDWRGEIEEVSTMETSLESDGDPPGSLLPVWLESHVTEIGTLDLWCVARESGRRWRLEFNLREMQPTAG